MTSSVLGIAPDPHLTKDSVENLAQDPSPHLEDVVADFGRDEVLEDAPTQHLAQDPSLTLKTL